jgi:hypothetical protein
MIPVCRYAHRNIEDNLFYSSIKLMPPFSEETKKDLTAKYTAKSMIN